MKKHIYLTSLGITLFFNIGCVSYSSDRPNEIQKIEFNSSELFPQGGSFTLSALNNKCVLEGKSYTDYSNYDYKYYFNGSRLIDGKIIHNKYKDPLFINSTPIIEDRIVKKLTKDKNIAESFKIILSYFETNNLMKCSF